VEKTPYLAGLGEWNDGKNCAEVVKDGVNILLGKKKNVWDSGLNPRIHSIFTIDIYRRSTVYTIKLHTNFP